MKKILYPLLISLIITAGIISSGLAQAAPPGVKASLALDKSEYALNSDPIQATITLENVSGADIITKAGFTASPFHLYLVFMDPNGNGITATEFETSHLEGPPPQVLYVGGVPVQVEAVEVLPGPPAAWVLSVSLPDARAYYALSVGGMYSVKAIIQMKTYPAVSYTEGGIDYAGIDTSDFGGAIETNSIDFTLVTDADGDGYSYPTAISPPYGTQPDCDDNNPAINPGAAEIPNDGIDQDCSGADSVVASRLGNISTRGPVRTGYSVMIGGFIISGSAPRSVLIRGFGPTLADWGVSDAMSDPYIELYSGQTMIATNDNWQTQIAQCSAPAVSCGTPQQIQATGKSACSVATTGCNMDSAILVTLPPGAYTAILRGVDGETGVGLVAVDDNDTSPLSKLVNISTRGPVLTGDSVMIGGFIIDAASGSKQVLIRGFGPTLADWGVQGVLSDPYIELYSGQTMIATNDNWQTQIAQCSAPAVSCGTPQQIQATGKSACSVATTGCAQDAAILVTLPPGAYTAIMKGVGGETGVGLVGIDEISP